MGVTNENQRNRYVLKEQLKLVKDWVQNLKSKMGKRLKTMHLAEFVLLDLEYMYARIRSGAKCMGRSVDT